MSCYTYTYTYNSYQIYFSASLCTDEQVKIQVWTNSVSVRNNERTTWAKLK